MNLTLITKFITSVGFPVAVTAAIGFLCYKFVIRVMDENQVREDGYKELLRHYGDKLGEISTTLATINNRLDTLDNQLSSRV